MMIVTYADEENGMEISAMTLDEYQIVSQELRDLVTANEWVWQMQPTLEAAIARHVEAHDAWQADQEAGRPEKTTY